MYSDEYFMLSEEELKDVIGAKVLMLLDDDELSKLVILVEGENDIKLFERYVELSNVRFIYMGGKKYVEIGLASILESKEVKIIGIVDSDFDNIRDTKKNIEELFYTDTHDVETLILRVYGCGSVLREKLKHKDYKNFNNKEILDNTMEIAKIISESRLYALDKNKSYFFKNMKYEKFINFETLKINKEKFYEYIDSRSKEKININDINEYIIKKGDLNQWQMCSGHDITNILAGYIKKYNKYIHFKDIESILRVSLETAIWTETELFKSILKWSEKEEINIFNESCILESRKKVAV